MSAGLGAIGEYLMDTHEASVWEIPDVAANTALIKKVRQGKATLADLTSATAIANGVVQRGAASDDYGAGCPDTGNGCVDFYAVSIPGVTPSRFITWFQAAAAARNSRKRLPTNAEWQAAALGTPDPGVSAAGSEDCNTKNGGGAFVDVVVPTGSRSNCFSDVGAFDMVGNLWEWVADWVPRASGCGTWAAGFGSDLSCMDGAAGSDVPGALFRGGDFLNGTGAGVFAVAGSSAPSNSNNNIGFRAAR
jgi:hypothetical protein